MDPEKKFLNRMAEIHGFGRNTRRKPSTRQSDVRHLEFQAMADFRLGEGFDPKRLKQVEEEQIALDQSEAEFTRLYESHQLTAEQHFESLQSAFEKTLEKYEDILGRHDFERLFGVTRSEAIRLVNRDTFFQSQKGIRPKGHNRTAGSAAVSRQPTEAAPDLLVIAGEIRKMAKLAGLQASQGFLEALSQKVVSVVKKGVRSPPAKKRSGVVSRKSSLHRASGTRILVTTNAVKMLTQTPGHSSAGGFVEGLSAMVRKTVENAIKKVRTDGKKKTLGPEDLI